MNRQALESGSYNQNAAETRNPDSSTRRVNSDPAEIISLDNDSFTTISVTTVRFLSFLLTTAEYNPSALSFVISKEYRASSFQSFTIVQFSSKLAFFLLLSRCFFSNPENLRRVFKS